MTGPHDDISHPEGLEAGLFAVLVESLVDVGTSQVC